MFKVTIDQYRILLSKVPVRIFQNQTIIYTITRSFIEKKIKNYILKIKIKL